MNRIFLFLFSFCSALAFCRSRLVAGTAYGGWGFHTWRVAGFDYRYTAAEAAEMVADGSVTNSPVFNRGYEPMLRPDATGDEALYALAKYVPAVSSPVGGMAIMGMGMENHNLNGAFDYRNGGTRTKYRGSSLDVRFPPPSGGYWFKKIEESEFKGPFVADTNAVYHAEFSFFEKKVGETWRECLFPRGEELVLRTRCETDEDGNLKKATYGKISQLRFGWGDNGRGDLRLGYSMNPTPNDTNLEPRREAKRQP